MKREQNCLHQHKSYIISNLLIYLFLFKTTWSVIKIYFKKTSIPKFNNYRIYNIFYDLDIPNHFPAVSAICIHPNQLRMLPFEYPQFLKVALPHLRSQNRYSPIYSGSLKILNSISSSNQRYMTYSQLLDIKESSTYDVLACMILNYF